MSKTKANVAIGLGCISIFMSSNKKGSKGTLISYEKIVDKAKKGEPLSIDELRDFVFAEDFKCSQIVENFYKTRLHYLRTKRHLVSAWMKIIKATKIFPSFFDEFAPYKSPQYEEFIKENQKDISPVPSALGISTITEDKYYDVMRRILLLILSKELGFVRFTWDEEQAMIKENPQALEWVTSVWIQIQDIYTNRKLVAKVAPPNDFWEYTEYWGDISPYFEKKIPILDIMMTPPASTAFVWEVFELLNVCLVIERVEDDFTDTAMDQIIERYTK